MKPVATSITQIDSMPGEEIAFSIGDARWVMRTQADLYSNRELAVAREYSTNAYDANKEYALRRGAEVAPIHVTLPSMMHPYFKVRDYGDGMSREVLAEVYTKFGESTKRDSNEFNGMLGYGCKSAVAYTDTFTVTSIHAGIKTIAVITRKPDWSIVMKIVSQSHSDDLSGTEVQVPVHNWQEFYTKAMDFYKFWPAGSVLVNGTEPVQEVGEKITDGLYYSKSSGWNGKSYVVMGNVPYRIENAEALFRTTKMDAINFVAYVDNGDVEFTPSREDLKYTEHTKRGLHKVITDFEGKITATAKADIDKATTHAEAYDAWYKWTGVLGTALFGDLTFKGDKFHQKFNTPGAIRYRTNVHRYAVETHNQWTVAEAKKTMFVTDFDLVSLSHNNRSKAKEYLKLKGWDNELNMVLFLKGSTVDSVWVSKDHVVKWEDLKAAVPTVRQASLPTGRPKGSYDFYTKDGYNDGKAIPVDNRKVYYITAKQQKPDYGNKIVYVTRLIQQCKDDIIVVRLGENRIPKFRRENPTVTNYIEYIKTKFVVDGASLLTNEAKEVKAVDYNERRWLSIIDVSKINDPEFARVKSLIKNETALFAKYEANLDFARALNMGTQVTQFRPANERKIATANYPLLQRMSVNTVGLEDIYIYINAKYAALEAARKDNA